MSHLHKKVVLQRPALLLFLLFSRGRTISCTRARTTQDPTVKLKRENISQISVYYKRWSCIGLKISGGRMAHSEATSPTSIPA